MTTDHFLTIGQLVAAILQDLDKPAYPEVISMALWKKAHRRPTTNSMNAGSGERISDTSNMVKNMAAPTMMSGTATTILTAGSQPG